MNGTNGRDGVSVTATALAAGDAHCASGGAAFTAVNGAMTLKGIGLNQINVGVLQLNAVPTIIGSCGSPDHAVRAGDVALVVGPLGTPVLTPPGSNQLLVC